VRHQQVLQLPGLATSVASARQFAVDVGAELDADPDLLPHIALVVSELATNAVQASPGELYELTIHRAGRHLVVEVCNRAARTTIPDRSRWKPGNPLAVRGRGLGIVDELTDDVHIDTRNDLVRVRVRIKLHP
jgi:anti-sigma regulatory factor (Ser/Thr protein kinase)